MFDRHKGTFFHKKKVALLIRRLCIWVYIFRLRNSILLDLKTKTHCLLIFLSYVIQFIYLVNDKSVVTSQQGYIPLSLFSQLC